MTHRAPPPPPPELPQTFAELGRYKMESWQAGWDAAIEYRDKLAATVPKTTFALFTPKGDEGPMIFEMNGVEIARCDHDSAGWQGMRDQRNLFLAIARELKVPVHHFNMGQHEGVIE